MIRIAAVGDVHAGKDSVGTLSPHFATLDDRADVLLLAGDLTRCGDADEAAVLAKELSSTAIPKVAVLGNHDFHADQEDEIRRVLEEEGVAVLDGDATTVEVGGKSLGIAGSKGFGGGFAGASGTEFGERLMKEFIRHTRELADEMATALAGLDTDYRVALLHYAPVEETLLGERLEIYPFLGSYLLGHAVDEVGADLIIHGHAHGGTEKGMTPGGIPVRNVAQPVIRQSYGLFCLGANGSKDR